MSKNIFPQSAGLQLSNSAQSQIASKPQRSEPITFELNGDGARLDLAAVVQAAPFDALASVTEAQPTPTESFRALPPSAMLRSIPFNTGWCRWRCWARTERTGISSPVSIIP